MFDRKPYNAADIAALADMLAAASVGGVVTYADMDKAIGRSVREHRYLLLAATKQVEREHGCLFGTVRNVGVKRLTSDETADAGLTTLQRIRRTATRGSNRLGRVRTNDMEPEQTNRLIAHRSQLGAVALIADGNKGRTVTKEVARSGRMVPAGRVLDMFKGAED